MPLLIFLSGVLFKKSIRKHNMGELLRQKTVKLLYPYITWGFIAIVLEYAMLSMGNGAGDDSEIALSWVLRNTSPYWFLTTLLLSIYIVAILHHISKGKAENCLLLGTFAVWFISGLRDRDIWMYLFFIMGYIVSDNLIRLLKRGVRIKHLGYIICISAVIYIALMFCIGPEDIQYRAGLVCLINGTMLIRTFCYFLRAACGIVIILCVSVVIASSKKLQKSKIYNSITWAGRLSLQMYLLQKVFVEYLGRFVVTTIPDNLYPDLLKNEAIYSSLACAIAVLSCFVLNLMANRLEKTKYLKKILL